MQARVDPTACSHGISGTLRQACHDGTVETKTGDDVSTGAHVSMSGLDQARGSRAEVNSSASV